MMGTLAAEQCLESQAVELTRAFANQEVPEDAAASLLRTSPSLILHPTLLLRNGVLSYDRRQWPHFFCEKSNLLEFQQKDSWPTQFLLAWNSFSKDWQRQKENGTNDEGIYTHVWGRAFSTPFTSKGKKSLLLWGIFEHFNVGERTFLREKEKNLYIIGYVFSIYLPIWKALLLLSKRHFDERIHLSTG